MASVARRPARATRRSTKVGGGIAHKLSAATRPAHGSSDREHLIGLLFHNCCFSCIVLSSGVIYCQLH